MEAESAGETGRRTDSFQRMKPPWLKLDIPTIQLMPEDPPQVAQVRDGAKEQDKDLPSEFQVEQQMMKDSPAIQVSPSLNLCGFL